MAYIKRLFESTLPQDLLVYKGADVSRGDDAAAVTLNYSAIIIKCVVQLELIQAVLCIMFGREAPQPIALVHPPSASGGAVSPADDSASDDPAEVDRQRGVYQFMATDHLLMLIDCLERSHAFAEGFNANEELRTALWKAGFTKQQPNLYKQEIGSLTCMVHILLTMYNDASREAVWPHVEARLKEYARPVRGPPSSGACTNARARRSIFVRVLTRMTCLKTDKEREVWSPLAVLVLMSLNELSMERVRLRAPRAMPAVLPMRRH